MSVDSFNCARSEKTVDIQVWITVMKECSTFSVGDHMPTLTRRNCRQNATAQSAVERLTKFNFFTWILFAETWKSDSQFAWFTWLRTSAIFTLTHLWRGFVLIIQSQISGLCSLSQSKNFMVEEVASWFGRRQADHDLLATSHETKIGSPDDLRVLPE
jgi:hypothetical protein